MTDEERKQQAADAVFMRNLDKKFGITKDNNEDILLELNKRIRAYVGQFPYPVDALIFQTLQDFQKHFSVLQVNKAKSVDYFVPVAVLPDGKLIRCVKRRREDVLIGDVVFQD